MSGIKLEHVYKDYVPGIHAVNDFNLEIEDGEFIVLVGPSGCGKTTTLRMLAGLEDITAGHISIAGEVVNDIHPKDRDIAMVFQNYALYPHMTVRENMGFGLKMQKVSKDEIDKRTEETAEIIGLSDYLDRLPKELSGGQRQRVALGRAIVRRPKAFLMDEPLSNLDAKLRAQTRKEISQIARNLGVTTVYVTHDQVEAMTMADRIVIMSHGEVQQVGTPRQVYLEPNNLFVAGFMGSPAMNFINVKITRDGIFKAGKYMMIPEDLLNSLLTQGYEDKDVVMGVRPEYIHLYEEADESIKPYSYTGVIQLPEMLGSETLLHFDVLGDDAVAKIFSMQEFKRGQEQRFSFDFNFISFFDKDTTERIITPRSSDLV